MDDKRIPKDASFIEEPAETAPFYGTSSPQKAKSSHRRLIIGLCLLVILLCTTQMLVLILGVRIERTADGWRLTTERQGTQPTRQTVFDAQAEGAAASGGKPQILLTAAAEIRSTQENYERLSVSVLCLTVERMDGAEVCTGVLITADGWALTSCGDLREALSLSCRTADGSEAPTVYLGTDSVTGLSLLRLTGEDFVPAVFGAAADAAVGQSVFSVGNPNGELLRNVLSEGSLTAVGQTELSGTALTLLQSSATFDSGGTGSPVADGSGRVIGLTTVLPGGQTDAPVAIAAEDLQDAIDRILACNAAAELDLGFDVGQIPTLCAAYYRYPGTLWIRQICDPRLEQAGLYERDVILEADGRRISTWEEFCEALSAHGAGERIELLIYRDGTFYEVRMTVQGR